MSLPLRGVWILAFFAAICAGRPLNVLVQDPTAAVVPGALVQVRSKATDFSAEQQSGSNGVASFGDLRDGEYQLTVSKAGFENLQKDIGVGPGMATEVTVQLKVASQSEEIEISGGTSKRQNADPVYRALRMAGVSESYTVENLKLKRDAGTFELRRGTLTFNAPVQGRVTKAVFLGEGEFVLSNELKADREFLRLTTGSDELKETFRSAVFVFSDGTYEQLKAQGKPVALDGKAAGVLSDFHKKMRHRTENPRSFMEALLSDEDMDNIDADLMADLYGKNRVGSFSAFFSGNKHKDLRYHFKPQGALPRLPAPEETALLNVDTNGDNDGILYLSHSLMQWKMGKASSHEDKRTIQAERYQIETVLGKSDKLNAVAKIGFSTVRAGDRVIKFSLLPNLRVTRVAMGETEIDYIQQDRKADGSFYVVLPEALAEGKKYEITVEYAGDKVVQNAGGGNYYIGARTSWYPNVNSFQDRAQFDLTFKVPNGYSLVSVGKLEKEWKEDKSSCSHWVSDVPLTVAGFNYGAFKKKQMHDDALKYDIEGYAISELPEYLRNSPVSSLSASQLSERAMMESQNALRIYNHWFGKSDYPRLALTQQPQFGFGQSWPELVYLPLSSFLDATQRWQLMGGISKGLTDFVQEVTPHEVAHQWWGHMVGWASFHDQWLSEGFADFSAGLYLQLAEQKPDKYLNYWKTARQMILEKNQYGRTANEAGPLWLGLRLGSAHNPSAYRKLIYPKGGYVLHMLRWMMYDEQNKDAAFIQMMHDFVETHRQQNASTESFKTVVERHMKPNMNMDGNGKMNWFFNQFVYGTDVPKYDFQYTITDEANGGALVKGTLAQSMVSDGFKMLVPLYADFDGRLYRLGEIAVAGNSSAPEFSIKLPKKPKRMVINANYDVLERK